MIDTNICSAFLQGNQAVWNKFMQYSGGLGISAITAGELWTWVSRGYSFSRSQSAVTDLINSVEVIDLDLKVALRFGELRGLMLDDGIPMPDIDGLIAATALSENLTLVTHNVADFQNIPNLRIENWLA